MNRVDAFGWARRVAVVALYTALLATLVALFVPLALVAAASDVLRRQPWTALRTLTFFVWYLLCEVVGVLAAAAIWLLSGTWAGADRRRFLDRNFTLQCLWGAALGRGAFRIFGIRVRLDDGGYRFGERPVLVFIRHASTADTILAVLFLSIPHRLRLRYVLKRELLWDPCLDIVGNRLPNVFVRRDSAQTAAEAAAVAALAEDLGPGDGVLIYPEGTRFSHAKKERIVARMRSQGREADAARAEALRHVLPPRSGGPLALLAAAPDADVLFVAHTGFEDSASFDRFFNGGLVGRTVDIRIRACRASDVPAGDDDRRQWLFERWREVDAFIDERRGGAPSA